MRRAVILIVVMTLLGIGLGTWMERSLQLCCRTYADSAGQIRQWLENGDTDRARQEEALLHSRWQEDESWLKMLVSHHHTRSVEESLVKLATSLEHGWYREALLALDAFSDALADLEDDMVLRWDNVL